MLRLRNMNGRVTSIGLGQFTLWLAVVSGTMLRMRATKMNNR